MKLRVKHLFCALFCSFAIILLVHAQSDQSGFISLDCGLPANSSYSNRINQIYYMSDEPFIDTGVSRRIAPEYEAVHHKQIAHVRSFPQGIRNCYRVNITSGTKYLIRATFVYGNYDGLNQLPKFDLHLGPNFWDSLTVDGVSLSTMKEVIHIPSLNYIHICLVNTGSGTPFISSLELRTLKNTIYTTKGGSLALKFRLDFASTSNKSYRYDYDAFDRAWRPYNLEPWAKLSTSPTVDSQMQSEYQVPLIVMSTASTPMNASTALMNIRLPMPDTTAVYYAYLHFAEIQQLKANQSRSFNLSLNGKFFSGPVEPEYLKTITVVITSSLPGGSNTFSLLKTKDSTLPPILNAMEVYKVMDFSQSETNGDDAAAIENIKSEYGLEKNWQGDPCAPQGYVWKGLDCSYNGLDPPRIITLNLSSSGLNGNITSYITNLSMLQYLDLSNNSLTGSVPQFLSKLPNLMVLNLERNKLSGEVPAELIEKLRKGSLNISFGENPNLSGHVPSGKKNKFIIPLVVSIIGISIILLFAAFWWSFNRKRQYRLLLQDKYLTKSEIDKITNNFTSIIGGGGFGKVYRGTLNGEIQVAVKVLASSSKQGPNEFKNEVELLMRAHHRNLVSLIGYCNEGDTMALVYEYVENGNLEQHLSADVTIKVLTWKERLQIAGDIARGLEYLHDGCRPPIVHRDLKTSNILLKENLQVKIADFGLSKVLATESTTHVTTDPKGTFGYLDHQYYTTGKLSKKSDIYSFGIVLLELITGQPAIITDIESDPIHICQWVSPKLERLEIESIVDSRLQGTYNISSARKAIEIAMACVPSRATERPDITVVCNELKECWEIEVPPEITMIPELNESDDSSSSSGSTHTINVTVSQIESEPERRISNLAL